MRDGEGSIQEEEKMGGEEHKWFLFTRTIQEAHRFLGAIARGVWRVGQDVRVMKGRPADVGSACKRLFLGQLATIQGFSKDRKDDFLL